ncbi:acyl carrier protein [Clostridium sp. UBA7503]|uniref:acyl carrier protein n=1 Tax=Clostridium sp. UBA7503 TaxID=1946377 RepID=UPI0032163908
MKNKLYKVFNGIISQESMNLIINDFKEVADTDIQDLGVDSLAIMELLFRIEELLQIEIDYESFKIEQIKTPRLILDMLNSKKQ